MVKALEKNIKFILEKIAGDIKVFMEVYFKLINLYPELANNDDSSSITESGLDTERGENRGVEDSEAKSDTSTEYSDQSSSQELSLSISIDEDDLPEISEVSFQAKIQ